MWDLIDMQNKEETNIKCRTKVDLACDEGTKPTSCPYSLYRVASMPRQAVVVPFSYGRAIWIHKRHGLCDFGK